VSGYESDFEESDFFESVVAAGLSFAGALSPDEAPESPSFDAVFREPRP
jgi:hypothetical protein